MIKQVLVSIALIGSTVVLLGQGSGTPSQIRVITDATGALVISEVAQTLPLSQPTVFTNARLRTDSSGNLVTAVASGGTSPGGSSGAIQYNNAGSFGGFGSWDGSAFSVNSGTLTANHPFTLTQTWNNAAATFEAFIVNVTNTASTGSVRLISLQKDGVEQVYVTPNGLLGAQQIDSAIDIHAGGDFQLAPNHQYLFSDGVDYGVGLKRDANTTLRASNGSTGVADFKSRHLLGGGSTPAVTNTSANSCGTTAATIVGSDIAGKITVGATSGTSCTVTFVTAFANAPACVATNETTANLARCASTTTTLVITGTFVAGDVVSYMVVGY